VIELHGGFVSTDQRMRVGTAAEILPDAERERVIFVAQR
jgi:hypothetical protein